MRTGHPANAWIIGERVQMTIYASSPGLDLWYRVSDDRGALWQRGRLRAGGDSPALLELRDDLPTGLYTLRLKSRRGATVEEKFCIIPDPDENIGDGRIFGVNYRPTTQEQWDALARMGVRNLRAEFSWPAVETAPGQYDLRYVDYIVSNAEARGIRLTVLTGHTPKFYSVPPVDRTGRVAGAWFTWEPSDTVEWFNFMRVMGSRLLGEQLPPRMDHATGRTVGGGSLVAAWEIWSEADQNFYYGDWNRYLDMLRVAYCTLKQHDARVPVVYGSCGHWTEASYTVQSNCQDYFDLMAHHPGGTDPNHSLGHWFVNMPQVFLKPGAPRESAYTECYFHPADPQYEAGFQLRLFATLKAWRQRHFIRSGCMGGVIGDAGVHHHALLWKDGDRLIPREAYVSFAVARWLLEDAVYVGPLIIPVDPHYTQPQPPPESAQVELFIRHGRPLVTGWGDGSRSLRLQVDPGAQFIDHMGRARELRRSNCNIPLGPNAVAVLGVKWQYVARALKTNNERLLTTELGYYSDRNSGYLDPLERDAAVAIRAGFGDEVRAGIKRVCQKLRQCPERAPAELFALQQILEDGMTTAARRCQETGSFPPVARNTIWRLAQYIEDLGMIADSLSTAGSAERRITDRQAAELAHQAGQLRARVRSRHQGAECPFAERLLDRACEQLDRVSMNMGGDRGAWRAARALIRTARAVACVESPMLRRVFAVVSFPTGQAFTKATLLPPSRQHQAAVRVYNFLNEPVQGTLSLLVPDDWGGGKPAVSFDAPAGGCSESLEIGFEVPENPRPWVPKAALRPCGELPVDLPAPLAPNTDAWIGGALASGPALPQMKYRLCVGAWAGGAGEMRLASR
ncbi:MAG: hypothetical protein J7M38_10085 [Armatimonadetes bacterium]|nr:hypothetical protein [Armatimonadota bacterium]